MLQEVILGGVKQEQLSQKIEYLGLCVTAALLTSSL